VTGLVENAEHTDGYTVTDNTTSAGYLGVAGDHHYVTVTNMMRAGGQRNIRRQAGFRHCHIVVERRPALSTYRGIGDQ
jgi:catechol-2,3-dioxygenase